VVRIASVAAQLCNVKTGDTASEIKRELLNLILVKESLPNDVENFVTHEPNAQAQARRTEDDASERDGDPALLGATG
jgi:hypothetical protein